MRPLHGFIAGGLVVATALFGVCAASAQTPASGPLPVQNALTGTLKTIRDSGAIRIGYREASFPFSYVVSGRPIGYSIDLCRAIADEIVRELDDRPTKLEFVKVTSEDRLQAVASGKVDLECGSTTANTERAKQVAFSPIMFVAGTKLMVRKNSGIRSYRDLGGKIVVVTAGTTNEQVMKALNEKFNVGMTLISARDHGESYSLVATGKADAFATDDVLLYGFIARNKAEADLSVVGDFLSYDPYGIMFRKDDAPMAAAVRAAFEKMAANRDLSEIYHRWFQRATPTGENLDLAMSPQLSEIFRTMGLED